MDELAVNCVFVRPESATAVLLQARATATAADGVAWTPLRKLRVLGVELHMIVEPTAPALQAGLHAGAGLRAAPLADPLALEGRRWSMEDALRLALAAPMPRLAPSTTTTSDDTADFVAKRSGAGVVPLAPG